MSGAERHEGNEERNARMPFDEAAEKAVLGSMLIDNDCIPDVMAMIEPEAFYRERHRIIFRALTALYEEGVSADLVTLTDHLRVRSTLETVGSAPYLIGLGDSTPTAAYVENYARIVMQKAVLRDIITSSRKAIGLAMRGDGDASEIIDAAQAEVTHLLMRGGRGDFATSADVAREVGVYVQALQDAKGSVTGVPSGLTDLDSLLHGWQKGGLYVVGARPAMGKSAFALGVSYHAAMRGKRTAIFSLEMPNRDLGLRIVCAEYRISMERVRRGELVDRDWQRLADGLGRFGEVPLFFNDVSDITLNEVRSKARGLAARGGLDLLVIDYLQLIAGTGGARAENRQQEVSVMSRNLKLLARELDIPVLLLSQLSRQVEGRPNKRPLLSDLRESGAVEQDSDAVMFLYRDDYYDPASEEAGVAEVIVAKNRNGPTGTVKVQWSAEQVSFRDLAWRA